MNVHAGQLAYIKHASVQTFWIVSVLRAAPIGVFNLPDGHRATMRREGVWICESLSHPFNAPLLSGRRRITQFACIHDDYLRPLGDELQADETVLEIIEQLAPRRQLEHTR